MASNATENFKPTRALHANAKEVVVDSPELLSQIFAYADDRDLATYSRICKTWQSVAIAVRWRVIRNPIPLFNILAPMIRHGDTYRYAFSRQIRPSDWKRFEKYGRCVRSITFRAFLHSSAYTAIASTRTTLNLLPLLTKLRWQDDDNLSFLPIFLHSNVSDMRLTLSSTNPDTTFFDYLYAMPTQMPQLTALVIEVPVGRMEDDGDLGESALFELITAYPNLRKLGIPPSYASTRILDLVSTLEHLVHLRIGNHNLTLSRRNTPTPTSLIPATPGAQDNLTLSRLYSLDTSYETLSKYLQSFTNFHALTSLTAETPAIETRETIENTFRLIGERCQSLTQLVVTYGQTNPPPDVVQAAAADPSRRITFNTLQPLASLSHLQTLDLDFISPIWITDDEFRKLFSNFGNLRQLDFNCRPTHYLDDPPLTLRAMRTLIKCCPKIRRATLFLDATAPIPADDDDSDPSLLPHEMNFTYFGHSNIRDTVEVAMALSSMITMTTPYSPGYLDEDEREAVRRTACWEQVDQDLRIYQQVRSAERKRVLAWVKKTKRNV